MIPVKNILGTMKVNDLGNGKSSVEWSATFDVEENKEAQAREMFKGAWTMGINGIEKLINNKN